MQVLGYILGGVFIIVMLGVVVYNVVGLVKQIKNRKAIKDNNNNIVDDVEREE